MGFVLYLLYAASHQSFKIRNARYSFDFRGHCYVAIVFSGRAAGVILNTIDYTLRYLSLDTDRLEAMPPGMIRLDTFRN